MCQSIFFAFFNLYAIRNQRLKTGILEPPADQLNIKSLLNMWLQNNSPDSFFQELKRNNICLTGPALENQH